MNYPLQRQPYNPFNLIWILLAILIFLIIGVINRARAEEYTNNQIANAIYTAEGGAKAKVAYGILSIKVRNEAEARQVCLNTIKNQRIRHAKHKCGLDFISCLGNRYCPTQGKYLTNDEKRLNMYWVNNVKFFLRKEVENAKRNK